MTEAPREIDIVEELRWQKRYTRGRVPYTMERAAMEIERLRKELTAQTTPKVDPIGDASGSYMGTGSAYWNPNLAGR